MVQETHMLRLGSTRPRQRFGICQPKSHGLNSQTARTLNIRPITPETITVRAAHRARILGSAWFNLFLTIDRFAASFACISLPVDRLSLDPKSSALWQASSELQTENHRCIIGLILFLLITLLFDTADRLDSHDKGHQRVPPRLTTRHG